MRALAPEGIFYQRTREFGGSKAGDGSVIYGTAEAVPFQESAFSRDLAKSIFSRSGELISFRAFRGLDNSTFGRRNGLVGGRPGPVNWSRFCIFFARNDFSGTDGKGTGRSRHVIAVLVVPRAIAKIFHCFRWTCALVREETVGEEH